MNEATGARPEDLLASLDAAVLAAEGISLRQGGVLFAAAGARADAHLVAHVTDQNTTASNVQTRVTGSRPGAAPLVIMTPRSAWWTCTAERGGGISQSPDLLALNKPAAVSELSDRR